MRKKIEIDPCFYLNVSGSLKIVDEYHQKYDAIDKLLDKNSAILDAFHGDLKKFGNFSISRPNESK